ncbi:RNA-directed DNA polymerase, eukaryota, reverse transcriptase zinc-binding domain protein [Tanacetum coccineum]
MVDFEKAYDSVRWDFLDDVLGKFGFGDKWRKWIRCCLNSSKGSIIINGSPTTEFNFGKGLKQGDPLSPFLFLLVMESLHILFQRVIDAGLFHGINIGGSVTLSHMFYADDAVFVGEWNDNNITSLIHALDWFHKVSGLNINLSKSKIMGIGVENDKVSLAARKLGCLVLNTPFLYLGSYVGGDMHRLQSWDNIVERVRSRLSNWKMKTLSIGGRLTLIKLMLGSMPIFHMSLFKVPAGIIHILESIRSKFFNGHESSSKKATWVQWKKVLAPKENGGLGISSLYALNRGLMFKWVWRFLAHGSTLWSRIIKAIHGNDGNIDGVPKKGVCTVWTDIIGEIKILENKGINLLSFMKKDLGNGLSTMFWEEVWLEGCKLKDRFPRAYALDTCRLITVGHKLSHLSLTESFRRIPRDGIEKTQVDNLKALLLTVSLNDSQDKWNWDKSKSGIYSVASARMVIDSQSLPKGDIETRWIRYVPNKVNILAWKVMTNSLPTRFNISRRGIDIESLSCVNCDTGVETLNHLFFSCDMAKRVSQLIARWWDVPHIDIDSYGNWRSWIDNIKMPKSNKSMLEGVFYVTWWLLWNFRNKKIFEGHNNKKATFFDEFCFAVVLRRCCSGGCLGFLVGDSGFYLFATLLVLYKMNLDDYEEPRVLVTCRSREEFCLVTGLRFGAKYWAEYNNEDDSIPFRRQVFSSAKDGKPIIGKMVEKLITSEFFDRLHDDDAVSLCCVGILQFVLLGLEDRRGILDWILRLANDRDG